MSFLQAYNFSNPFHNFGGFGLSGNGVLQPFGTSAHFPQTGIQPTGASPLQYTTASNNLVLNQNPQSPATATAAQIQIPQSIVPNYNPSATTDYYGNPNQNFANQQAPIPSEYQQQQQQTQQSQAQNAQQIQQQQLQLQQQQLQLQQQQQQLQLQGHNFAKLKPHVLQVVPEEGQEPTRNRENSKDSFDVIIHDSTSDNGAEQVASGEIDPNLPPTQQPRRGRRKNRKPPQVVNYSPVKHVEYYAPLGGHHVQLHASSKKFSLHEVIDDPNQNGDQRPTQLNVNANGQVSINPAGTRGAQIPNVAAGNNVGPGPNARANSDAGPGPAEFGLNFAGPQPQQQQQTQAQNIVNDAQSASANNAANINDNANVINSESNVASLENARYFENENGNQKNASSSAAGAKPREKLRVTPIQGPIYAKDGMTPVVPLYSYHSVKNGTLYQIPILWTALSYALGLDIHGEVLRGLPCIKRLNQLYCPSAGTNYPLEKIEGFIDDNKSLIRRMYGEFIMSSDSYVGTPGGNSLRRLTRDIFEDEMPDILGSSSKKGKPKRSPHHKEGHTTAPDDDHISFPGNDTISAHGRTKRQTVNNRNGGPSQQPRSSRVDSCESTVEIVTPYWAANSGGKVRAIVNTQHFEQAIHQEVCRDTTTSRCSGDCGCEQKYKWHRLLAYDPDNDCQGIFMDWFLFPSCCVCRCERQQ